ncbi:hypothetical protein EDC04DRAFT_102344 [Pisolithus marmoratus]|nr:hypothetical protein EDC04DRAFT_102344 [Pisolithus marmoratus]
MLHTRTTYQHRYVVATQSQPIHAKFRLVPGVPDIHINRSVMNLAQPNEETQGKITSADSWRAQSIRLPQQPNNPPCTKNGPKGPNHLSVKKKVTRLTSTRLLWKRNTIAPSSPSNLSFGEKRRWEEHNGQRTATYRRKRRKSPVVTAASRDHFHATT